MSRPIAQADRIQYKADCWQNVVGNAAWTGQYIELIGTYNPATSDVKVNEEVAMKWLSQGALPTDTVRNLLSKQGVMKKFAESKTKKESK